MWMISSTKRQVDQKWLTCSTENFDNSQESTKYKKYFQNSLKTFQICIFDNSSSVIFQKYTLSK